MSAIKYDINLANAETLVCQMDRWGYPAYNINITAGTALVQGCLERINQGETPSWFTLDGRGGASLGALTAADSIEDTTPIDSIRITATGATTGTVIQTGG
jgi:hypothetical protein